MLSERTANSSLAYRPSAHTTPSEYNDSINRRFGQGGSRFAPTTRLDRYYIPTFAEVHSQQENTERGLYASIRDTVLAPPRLPLSQRSLSLSTNNNDDDTIPLYSAARYESATVRRAGGYWTTMRRPAETPSGRLTEIAPLTPLRSPNDPVPAYEQPPTYFEEALPAYGAAETPTYV